LPGFNYGFNISTSFINFFAWLGWATDFKSFQTVPENMIKDRILRTGDGSHSYSKKMRSKNNPDINNNKRDIEHFWGFGDKTMTKDDMRNVKIINKTFS
jgi:stearoyl-CoA desaturase (Delta-9 desaturase)